MAFRVSPSFGPATAKVIMWKVLTFWKMVRRLVEVE